VGCRDRRRNYAVIFDMLIPQSGRPLARRVLGDSLSAYRDRYWRGGSRDGGGKKTSHQFSNRAVRHPHLSFFPSPLRRKGKTWSCSAGRVRNGTPEAFHVYSMRQAIEEKFILDVLANYTTYATYYRLLGLLTTIQPA